MTSSEEDPGSTSVEEKPGATSVDEDPGPALGAESVNAGGQPSRNLHADTDESRLPASGDSISRSGVHQDPHPPLTPWELHDTLKNAYLSGGTAALTFGALLRQVRDRRLWSQLGFADFDGYVRERLAMSARTARRLIRAEAAGWRHPSLKTACTEGHLTPLKASVLIRVLDLGLKPATTYRWIEYARRMTLTRLTDAVDWACARAAADPLWVRRDGAPPHPSVRFDGGTINGSAVSDAAATADGVAAAGSAAAQGSAAAPGSALTVDNEGSNERRPMLAGSAVSASQAPPPFADFSRNAQQTGPMLATSPPVPCEYGSPKTKDRCWCWQSTGSAPSAGRIGRYGRASTTCSITLLRPMRIRHIGRSVGSRRCSSATTGNARHRDAGPGPASTFTTSGRAAPADRTRSTTSSWCATSTTW